MNKKWFLILASTLLSAMLIVGYNNNVIENYLIINKAKNGF